MTIALQLHREAKTFIQGRGNVSVQDIELHRRLLQVSSSAVEDKNAGIFNALQINPRGQVREVNSGCLWNKSTLVQSQLFQKVFTS